MIVKGVKSFRVGPFQKEWGVNTTIQVSNTDHGDPEDYVLIDEAVEVLVEEEEAGADEGRVREAQLTLGHVRDLQRYMREIKHWLNTFCIKVTQ